MRKILLTILLALAACGNMDAADNASMIRASAFIYDPASPAVMKGRLVYDPDAPELRARRFIIEQ